MEKIKILFQENQSKIILLTGFILVAALSFEAGYLKGSGAKDPLISIENISKCPESPSSTISQPQANSNPTTKEVSSKSDLNPSQTNCAFVASKNSTKYHLPICSGAKRIKTENLVCFQNAEEAAAKGYTPSQDCLK